jgi:phage shock protein E
VIAMHTIRAAILIVATTAFPASAQAIQQAQQIQQAPVNPAIDMAGFLRVSQRAAQHRETRRVSEEEFARMSREAGTIVLDARSREKYDELHVRRAINLSFPDIAIASLKQAIPDKKTRILIYCNNNFRNAEGPFPSKLPSASLNISTYIALYNYGYRNVYELRDTLELNASRLEFESSASKQ